MGLRIKDLFQSLIFGHCADFYNKLALGIATGAKGGRDDFLVAVRADVVFFPTLVDLHYGP